MEQRDESSAGAHPLGKPQQKPEFRDMSLYWETFPQLPGDSTEFIGEDRDRYGVGKFRDGAQHAFGRRIQGFLSAFLGVDRRLESMYRPTRESSQKD